MTVNVGMDGGQSELRMTVCGESEPATGPGISHSHGDTVEAIIDTASTLWSGRVSDIGRLVAGLTTIPASEGDRRRLATGLSEATGAAEVWVCNDAVTFHAGTLGGNTGVALSVGTGVACLAVDAGRSTYRTFDGAGYLLGDEGGGFWIGRHGIRAALAANEGRGPGTTLTTAIEEQLGPLDDLAVRIHSHARPVDTIARTAMAVVAEARAGDSVADSIVTDTIRRLATTLSAAVDFLSRSAETSVVVGGRVAALLGAPLLEALRSVHPATEPIRAPEPGLAGACMLAGAATAHPYTPLITEVRRAA